MPSRSFRVITNKKILSFNKAIKVDSDKSISIRSLLFGAISEGISTVSNILESKDVTSTINCLKKLGVKILKKKNLYLIYGKGLGSLKGKKNSLLNFGNSGTLARLLIGLLSTNKNINLNLTGDHSLKKRSMKKLILLMSRFGATFAPKNQFYLPFKIISSELPLGVNYTSGVSAQLKSAVILGGLNSFGTTKILENERSRDHTERMLLHNKKVININDKEKKIIKINGKRSLKSLQIKVPGDPSSAAFLCALTILKKGSSIKIKGVGLNPTRIGFYKLLKKYGGNIKFKNLKKSNNELYGDIYVKYSKMKPLKAPKKYYVSSTDEYPILFVIAALTKGVSIFNGIEDLANKESNRILEMQKVFSQLGIRSKASKNQMKIIGSGMIDGNKKKILVENLGDHRICMASFILSILTGARAEIKNFETVFTSSPSFLKIMKSLGAEFDIKK